MAVDEVVPSTIHEDDPTFGATGFGTAVGSGATSLIVTSSLGGRTLTPAL